MTSSIGKTQSRELTESNKAARQLATRLDHAWQSRCAKVARADADYRELAKRAILGESATEANLPADQPQAPAEATA